MTITLDDVFCLLHLPMTGKPIDHVSLTFDRNATKVLLMTHLRISIETVVATNTDAKVRLTWLANPC